jgi:hypothetical protein
MSVSADVANDLMKVLFKWNPKPLEALGACVVVIGKVLARLDEKNRAAVLSGLLPMIEQATQRSVEGLKTSEREKSTAPRQ